MTHLPVKTTGKKVIFHLQRDTCIQFLISIYFCGDKLFQWKWMNKTCTNTSGFLLFPTIFMTQISCDVECVLDFLTIFWRKTWTFIQQLKAFSVCLSFVWTNVRKTRKTTSKYHRCKQMLAMNGQIINKSNCSRSIKVSRRDYCSFLISIKWFNCLWNEWKGRF